MALPLSERLAEIGRLLDDSLIGPGRDDARWMHRILSRLGDEKVVEAAARAMCVEDGYEPDLVPFSSAPNWRWYETAARTALSAALGAAMEE